MTLDNAAAFHEAALRELKRTRLEVRADASGSFPDDAWRRIADAGWLRVLLSEEHGGLGQGLPELGAIFRAVGLVPMRGPLLDHAVTLPLLMASVADRQRTRLEAALDGRAVVPVAEALPPPYGRGAGALRIDDGRLSGTAELVPFGAMASSFVVNAVRDGRSCIVIVAADRAHTRAVASVDPSVDYGCVQFEHVTIGHDDVLVEGATADALLRRARSIQRLMMASELAGAVEAMLAMTVEYAMVRHQFGRAIGSFQALQHMLATLAVRSSALSNLASWSLLDAEAEPERLDEIAAIAKAYAGEVGRQAAEECLQIHGAIGFTEELTLHRHYRRVLTHQGFLGESDALFRALGEAAVMGLVPA